MCSSSAGSSAAAQPSSALQGAWLTDDEVDKVMQQYDADGSGDISFEEFARLVSSATSALPPAQQAAHTLSLAVSNGLTWLLMIEPSVRGKPVRTISFGS